MYVTRSKADGLRDALPEWSEHDRVVELPAGPDPARCALADSLVLFAAALHDDPGRLLVGLEWGVLERVGDADLGDLELHGLNPAVVQGMVEPGHHSITVDVELQLDEPAFAQLRRHAARDPRLVTALGQRPALSVKVGWLFNGDYTVATPSTLGVRVGDVAFETVGRERPPWLPEVLGAIGNRFLRTDPFEPPFMLAERLRSAMMSHDPERRRRFAELVHLFGEPPFDTGRGAPSFGIAEYDRVPFLVFGEGLHRLRQVGRATGDALRVAAAAWIDRPDVLVVTEPVSAGVLDWLRALPELDDAPVEQVWVTS